jgi:AcrR family transcriptional regulator
MTVTEATLVNVSEIARRIRTVPAPRPILDRRREDRLTRRQRQLLDQLGTLFDDGFAEITMAELAASLSCSLRTLYSLAPSRDELVLIVVDRYLWRVGRAARDAIDPGMAPLDALRAYLRGATVAVSRATPAFIRDLDAVPAARRLWGGHNDYLFAVTRTLLELAVEQGDMPDVDVSAVGRVISGLGSDFSRPDVIPTLRSSPKEAADAVVDIVLRGLRTAPPTDCPTPSRSRAAAPYDRIPDPSGLRRADD